jgi:poly-gamma-glutamate system protein
MKKVYWRPAHLLPQALLLVACLSLAALTAVESVPLVEKQRFYAEKMAAARLAREGMDAIKEEKQKRGYVTPADADPAGTGMIGESVTPVTSNTGFLDVKLTSTNPNFAAVVLDMLAEAGVGEGDVVAVGVSGSFPALNVSTYAALMVLKVKAISIASASSSEWGANHVDYLWLDMERTLQERGVVDFGSAAASHGGIDDLGLGITERGRALIDAAMERSGVHKIGPASLEDSIARRMALYDELAGDAPIKAYVNVGGGSASVGTHVGKKQFRPGLNTEPPRAGRLPDSVMLRFARRDIPVIHISSVKVLAERYGLPIEPRTPVPIGQGSVFVKTVYNRWLAALGLVVVVAAMIAFLRWDVGMRLLSGLKPKPKSIAPEQMV